MNNGWNLIGGIGEGKTGTLDSQRDRFQAIWSWTDIGYGTLDEQLTVTCSKAYWVYTEDDDVDLSVHLDQADEGVLE